MDKQCLHKFENFWSIDLESLPSKFKIKTPKFSPLPNNNGLMRFKISLIECGSFQAVFQLKLLKVTDFNCSPSLEMDANVTVFSKAGSLVRMVDSVIGSNLTQYSIKVDRMTSVCFKEFCWSDPTKDLILLELSIKCTLEFYDKKPISLNRWSHSSNTFKQVSSLNTTDQHVYGKIDGSSPIASNSYKQTERFTEFVKNLKAVYKPGAIVLSDFVFNVGNKSLPAHRIVLAAQSPVLKKEFTQNSPQCKMNCVTIPYSTPEIFNLFLKYMYSGEVEDKSWSPVKELFYLADTYQVRLLREECTEITLSLLSVGLVCEILKLAYVYNDSKLISAAKAFALSHMNEIISRDDWKELVNACPMIGYEVLTGTFSSQNTTDHQKDYYINSPSLESSNCSRQTKSLAEFVKNLKSIYKTGASELSNIVFRVRHKSLPAHKIIPAAHSPVLMKMLTQDVLESKTNSVTIPNSSPEIFDLFLKYMYSGEVEDRSWSTVKELFYLADKYEVRLLKEECTDLAVSLLSVDLVCDVLKLALVYDDSSLKSAAIEFAVSHMKEIISRDDWKELVSTHPRIGYEVTFRAKVTGHGFNSGSPFETATVISYQNLVV